MWWTCCQEKTSYVLISDDTLIMVEMYMPVFNHSGLVSGFNFSYKAPFFLKCCCEKEMEWKLSNQSSVC